MSIAQAIALVAPREVLGRIGGPHGELARELSATRATSTARAEQRAELRAPLPRGMRNIHATWIEAALAELPPGAREVIANARLASPVEVWLARAATATFPALAAPDDETVRPATPEALATMSASALRAWLDDVGADQLAFAVGEQAARALGPLVTRAAQRIAAPPRTGELGPRRAAIGRANISIDDVTLLRIAGRAIAPHVAAISDLAARVTHRLPRPIGYTLAAELAAHAGAPIEHVPSWRALAADP